MDDIDRALSIKLFDVMDTVGVSEKIRKLYQDTSITHEIIQTLMFQIGGAQCPNYIFGSNCEGTTTIGLDSDVDIVFCDEQWPVIDNIYVAPRGQSCLMVRDDQTYPGYVKLQLIHNGRPMWYPINNQAIALGMFTDSSGRVCKSHPTVMGPNEHILQRHGPADTEPGAVDNKEMDSVYALRCKTIPRCANTWLDQRRRYNWPSHDVLQQMGDLGCLVVGVGHTSSREQHIEWRISFSLQERVLMFSLNPTQHKCYVLLKLIKKDIIKAQIGECISSYHCKTCLFRALEVTPAAIWTPDNLICCLRLCLVILLTRVVNGVCPNYFIPSENMFEKPQFHAKRCLLLKLLRALIEDGNSIILRLRCDDIGSRILQPGIVQNNKTETTIVFLKYFELYGSINLFWGYLDQIGKNCMALSQHIERLTNTRVICEHTEQQTRDAISYVIPVLHVYIAQRMASLACKAQGQEHERQLNLSINHFQHGNHADLMTSRLLLVSLLLRLENYDACESKLHDIENDVTINVVTYCRCFRRLYLINPSLLQTISANNVSCQTAIRTVFVGCVKFLPCDMEIVPLALQFEMYRSIGNAPPLRNNVQYKWFDWAAVDGRIYLYFLQYLVYSRLNKPLKKLAAMNKLVLVLTEDPQLGHEETAYNLLGWILVQEERIPEALWCFVMSWRTRPGHHAAKWHLCVALNKYYTG